MSNRTSQEGEVRRKDATTGIRWCRNEATYSPLEKAWGVRTACPLAIETTRFDSILVGCTLVVVVEDGWIGTMWDFAFSVAAFSRPGFP